MKSRTFKAKAHSARVARKSAARSRKRAQASVGRQTAPASQRGSKHDVLAAKAFALVKAWTGGKLARLQKRTDAWIGKYEPIGRAA